MRVVIDLEANGLKPTKIWCIVCYDIDTKQYTVFRDPINRQEFLDYAKNVNQWIGHNWLGYDYPALHNLLDFTDDDIASHSIDTLVVSKLVDYSRQGHSIEQYGLEFGLPKGQHTDFTKYSKEMEDYCVRDVEICSRIYAHYRAYITSPMWTGSIALEQSFQLVVNNLHRNGFAFNSSRANILLDRVTKDLVVLDEQILTAFPPREVLIREFIPKATKFGTISRTSVPRSLHQNIKDYQIGVTYKHTHLVEFNPASHKQVIEVLNEAGWKPIDKTKAHIETERLIFQSKRDKSLDLAALSVKMVQLKLVGWKINENNLSTLPDKAPAPARLLAKRILLESRRRTLTEWLGLVQDDRIHGDFQGIGAWTHRMAHQRPNTANIPNDKKEDGSTKLLGKELRSLWRAPPKRLLVGVDAEGIQLRIFAHYTNDKEFINAVVNGKKETKTDPHSINAGVLGCGRQAAKRFIYAWLLGAGNGKLAEILGVSGEQAKESLSRLYERYSGFAHLKREVIPSDARRGWFKGLDGRKVGIPGDTLRDRQHLAMSGYLQNGEAIIMKMATLKWIDKLKDYDSMLVNLVHDEWQTECPNDMAITLAIAHLQADSLRIVGEELKMKCPLAGSYYNDDIKDYTIGTNWSVTH